MSEYHTKTINFLFAFIILLIHFLVGQINFDTLKSNSTSRVQLKLKKPDVRQVGDKKSQKKEYEAIPSKKVDDDLLKKFNMTDTNTSKKIVEEEEKKKEEIGRNQKSKSAQEKLNFTSRQTMAEVKREKRIENPLLNSLDSHLQFIPPKGIDLDDLNEYEKMFYSFFKRVALQYVTSLHTVALSLTSDKPYLENKIRSHPPALLSAMIRYDKDGNAEVIKILKSSNDDDIHKLFEETLKRMSKIQNITKELIDEDGKYTAFYQLSINQSPK